VLDFIACLANPHVKCHGCPIAVGRQSLWAKMRPACSACGEKRGEIRAPGLFQRPNRLARLATEYLNRHWYERNTCRVVTEVQRQVLHPVERRMAATLDRMVEGTGAVVEAKFMLPWSESPERTTSMRADLEFQAVDPSPKGP
jgi:hypothetical protein